MLYQNLKLIDDIFKPLSGKKISYFQQDGNVGDDLIKETSIQLFNYYNIEISKFSPFNKIDYDYIVISGGGNLGSFYKNHQMKRNMVYKFSKFYNIPIIILPQTSYNENEKYPKNSTIYVRDEISHKMVDGSILSHDLALFFNINKKLLPNPKESCGNFFRTDFESTKIPKNNLGDPAKMVLTPIDYIKLASSFEIIHTNRLHFAISGLLGNTQKVFLYPNSYHKNKYVYKHSLSNIDRITFVD